VRQLSSHFHEKCINLAGIVKKILVLEGEAYGHVARDGGPLRTRRLQKFGRLELLHVLNDQPPYWFVMLRGFDPKRDLAPGLIDPSRGNVWRFLDLECAKTKLAELAITPWCRADEQKRRELSEKKKQAFEKVRIPFAKGSENRNHVKPGPK
jgi:hypothetical protein